MILKESFLSSSSQLAFAKEQNYQTISLTTLNLLPEAIEFYQKNNYKIIKTTDIGKDVGLVTMTKSQ